MKDWLAFVTNKSKKHKASSLVSWHAANLWEFTTYILPVLYILHNIQTGSMSDSETDYSEFIKIQNAPLSSRFFPWGQNRKYGNQSSLSVFSNFLLREQVPSGPAKNTQGKGHI